jgi:uncharacterized membrane protein YfcA
MFYAWLLPLGLVLGAFGTLVGAGGGFILVPVLILLYPEERPEVITSISLAVVFANALSGSFAYARMGRVDYRSGLLFAAAAMPGAVAGALATGLLPRRGFDALFGAALLGTAALLLLRRSGALACAAPTPAPGRVVRRLTPSCGTAYAYSFRPLPAVALSAGVGFVSSLLGIGGGILHVPALVCWLGFPAHVATATCQFSLVFMALAGSAVHIATGAFGSGLRRTAALSAGVLIGAQFGARLSGRVDGAWILRWLAFALAFVGLRVLLGALR